MLLHSTSRTNGEIMDELLTKWEEMGYSFRPLADLVGGSTGSTQGSGNSGAGNGGAAGGAESGDGAGRILQDENPQPAEPDSDGN